MGDLYIRRTFAEMLDPKVGNLLTLTCHLLIAMAIKGNTMCVVFGESYSDDILKALEWLLSSCSTSFSMVLNVR